MKHQAVLKAQRPFSVDVVFFNWPPAVPESEAAGDDDSDENADEEEEAVGGECDQQDGDYSKRDDETR